MDYYRCYYGHQIETLTTISYNKINQKEIQNNVADLTLETPLYFNYYLTENNDDLALFYTNDGLSINTQEKDSEFTFSEEKPAILFIFAQIPQGYRAFKRNNRQNDQEGEEVMVTENFYYYENKPDISYLFFDIKKDSTITSSYVYSFIFKIYKTFSGNFDYTNIRGIFTDTQSNEKI